MVTSEEIGVGSEGELQHSDQFEDCRFNGLSLSTAMLEGKRFADCTFSGCDLTNAVFADVALQNVTFTSCRLTGTDFTSCRPLLLQFQLLNCQAHFALFGGLDLKGLHFEGTDFTGADFSETVLQGADFTKAILFESGFEGADLSKADFTGSQGLQLRVGEARLDKAKLPIDAALSLVRSMGVLVAEG